MPMRGSEVRAKWAQEVLKQHQLHWMGIVWVRWRIRTQWWEKRVARLVDPIRYARLQQSVYSMRGEAMESRDGVDEVVCFDVRVPRLWAEDVREALIEWWAETFGGGHVSLQARRAGFRLRHMQLCVLLFTLCGCTSRWVGVDPGEWRRKCPPLQERVFLRWADRSRLAQWFAEVSESTQEDGAAVGESTEEDGADVGVRLVEPWGGATVLGEEPRAVRGGVGTRSTHGTGKW